HYLDLASAFLGELTPLEYHDDWRGGVEADSKFNLRSAGGVSVTIELSRLRSFANTIRFEGTAGLLEVAVDDLAGLTWKKNGISARVEPAPSPEPTFVACFAGQLS